MKQFYIGFKIGQLVLAVMLAAAPLRAALLTAVGTEGNSLAQVPCQADGRAYNVWKITPGSRTLNLAPEGAWPAADASGALYVAVLYLDKGYGRLILRYEGADGKMARPDKYMQVVMLDTGKWLVARFRLPAFGKGKTIGLSVSGNRSDELVIAKAAVQGVAFDDPRFQFLVSEPWKSRYTGPSAPHIANQTLRGKVMVGYQGWFRTPNDPYDQGWVHWGAINRGEFTTDMWPDTSGYPQDVLDKAADVKTLSGKTAYLFSSAWPEVEQVHFKWMREHNIDGAFVQRFLADGTYAINGRPEWVLGNVRAAANQEGRIWAVEYDVSGVKDSELLEKIRTDWKWLVDGFGIRQDPAYAHEGGKPVVFVWGMPFPSRNISAGTADAVVDFLRNDPIYGGNYVIGGIPADWRKMAPAWQEHIKKYDAVLCWMSKNYVGDVADFKKMGVAYWPHVWPGFSWANLKHIPSGSLQAYTPRNDGEYYRNLFTQAAASEADRLFVGMFDEYDESTAIIPMSDDPPPTPSRPGAIVTFFPGGKPAGDAKRILRPVVEQALDGAPPTKGIEPDNFFMRWEGTIIPRESGRYTISVEGAEGDGVALWLNDRRVAETKAITGGKPIGTDITLTAGSRLIYRIDYTRHSSRLGMFRLSWKGPSFDNEPVSASALVDAWGRFLTNEGHSPDLYLQLTSEARNLINKNAEDHPQ